ncbi:uncharacterized protein LOC112015493 [Quercus suber]|uniref:uncharacterized protein LOC112015493 n=1 Tax=Quercus suber TaxID=58331 RepID=UPI0032DEEF33
MAGVELLLPKEYGYVAFVLVFDCLSNLWMAAQVGKARKRFKVPYPTLYALESENKDAKLFNCVQRGHQHSLEMMPMFFMLMVLEHLQILERKATVHPKNLSNRLRYSTGVPQKRQTMGKYGHLALLGLMISTISFGVSLLL